MSFGLKLINQARAEMLAFFYPCENGKVKTENGKAKTENGKRKGENGKVKTERRNKKHVALCTFCTL